MEVILNLFTNALDALEESDKKEIDIEIFSDGEFIQVSLADSGCGIASENRQKIFDPFYTTKLVGKGTGPFGTIPAGHPVTVHPWFRYFGRHRWLGNDPARRRFEGNSQPGTAASGRAEPSPDHAASRRQPAVRSH